MVTFLVLPRKYAATWVGRMFSSSILLSAAVRFTSSSSRAHWRRQIKSRRFVHSTWRQQNSSTNYRNYVMKNVYLVFSIVLQQETVWGFNLFLKSYYNLCTCMKCLFGDFWHFVCFNTNQFTLLYLLPCDILTLVLLTKTLPLQGTLISAKEVLICLCTFFPLLLFICCHE